MRVYPNATRMVIAESQFNDPPKAGRQFLIARVRASYRGPKGSDTFDGGFRLRAVGRSNVSYTSFEDSCGVTPDEDALDKEVFRGGTVEGNVCWSVKRSDVGSLVAYDDGGWSFNAQRPYFKLH